MGFIKKIWKDRISEFPTRRSLTKTDGTSELVTVARSEGMISEEGDAFSAENMNDFENRVANGFSELNENINGPLLGAATYSYGKEITMSWAELSAKIKTEDFSGLHIGDYKDIVLSTGEDVRVDLSGFNTYMNVGDSDILTDPHLYFTFRDCLKTTYQMNSSHTNTGGYASSALAKTVNTTIYNTLPADLKSVMKEVRRMDNNKSNWAWASRKLWLLQETEVFGRNNWSDGLDGGGIQLPIFAHSYRHIVKGLGKGAAASGSRVNWWLASPYAFNDTNFCLVSRDGYTSRDGGGAAASYGVAPGFIIA